MPQENNQIKQQEQMGKSQLLTQTQMPQENNQIKQQEQMGKSQLLTQTQIPQENNQIKQQEQMGKSQLLTQTQMPQSTANSQVNPQIKPFVKIEQISQMNFQVDESQKNFSGEKTINSNQNSDKFFAQLNTEFSKTNTSKFKNENQSRFLSYKQENNQKQQGTKKAKNNDSIKNQIYSHFKEQKQNQEIKQNNMTINKLSKQYEIQKLNTFLLPNNLLEINKDIQSISTVLGSTQQLWNGMKSKGMFVDYGYQQLNKQIQGHKAIYEIWIVPKSIEYVLKPTSYFMDMNSTKIHQIPS